MSDTPRTDAQTAKAQYDARQWYDFARQLERELNAAKNIIADLLEHPYPHDLMAIRYTAKQFASEELAKRFMQHYCTEDEKVKALNEWKLAQETAREFLKS